MRRADNRWNIRVAEWVPKEKKHIRGRQQIRWSDEIRKFAGVSLHKLAQDRCSRRSLGDKFGLQRTTKVGC